MRDMAYLESPWFSFRCQAIGDHPKQFANLEMAIDIVDLC